MNSAGIAAILIACSLVVVVVLYAVNRGDEPVVTTKSPPATTTGQSQKAPEPGPSGSEPKAKSEEKKSEKK